MGEYRLVRLDGGDTLELRPGSTLVLGRSTTSDLPVRDETISRRHAELTVEGQALVIRDLGSSNGTRINGARIERAPSRPGDVVSFGTVSFRLEGQGIEPVPAPHPTPEPDRTLVRQLRRTAQGWFELDRTEGVEPSGETQRLRRLLEASKALGSDRDALRLIERIADMAFEVLEVDRVSILLRDPGGTLVPSAARTHLSEGHDAGHVPSSIARRAVEERVALLTENAQTDQRFGGRSVVLQSVRSALCAPLLGGEDEPLGVIYVDRVASIEVFTEDDLEVLVAFSGIAGAALANQRLTEQLAREAVVRSNFERYFAPDLVELISGQDAPARLGGERRPVVVFFSDIRGFTPLAERLQADEIASFLTEYFTEMVDIVFDHGGTLDKFIGDGLMALWGAPLALDDPADRAIAAALEMREALDRLNEGWSRAGRPALGVGIGMNYGEVFAGNIGSERRLEYTVIGDAVNLASRLCGRADAGDVLVTEDLRLQLKQPVPLEPLEPMTLRGRETPVRVFRVTERGEPR